MYICNFFLYFFKHRIEILFLILQFTVQTLPFIHTVVLSIALGKLSQQRPYIFNVRTLRYSGKYEERIELLIKIEF